MIVPLALSSADSAALTSRAARRASPPSRRATPGARGPRRAASGRMPALLTRMSSRPKRSVVVDPRRAHGRRSVTSARWRALARLGFDLARDCVCAGMSARTTIVTAAPPSARSSAIARPILRAAAGDDRDAAVQLALAHSRAHRRSTGRPWRSMRSMASASCVGARASQPPNRALSRNFARISARVSGSCAPPRIWGLRTSRTLPSFSVARIWPVKLRGILVVRIDHVGDFRGERAQSLSFTRSSVNCSKPALPSMKAGGDAIGRGEFRRHSRWAARASAASGSHSRCTVPSPTLQTMRDDVVGLDARARELDRAIDEGLRHRPAGIGLERDGLEHQARAEPFEQRREIRRLRRRERLVETVTAFEHRRGPGEPGFREQRRADARLRRSSRHAAAWSSCRRRDTR